MSGRKRQAALAANQVFIISSDSEDEHVSFKSKRRRSSSSSADEIDWKPQDEKKSSNSKIRCSSRRGKLKNTDEVNHELRGPPSAGVLKKQTNENQKAGPSILNQSCKRVQEPKRRKQIPAKENTVLEGDVMQDKNNFANPCTLKDQSHSDVSLSWKDSELLAEREGLDLWVANNLVNLLEAGNTIPFIARYRKELTRNMDPEQLRHCKESFEDVLLLKQKVTASLKSIEKVGKLTPSTRKSILCVRSLNELEHITAPFKTGSKRTLAARARDLGLGTAAEAILDGHYIVNLSSLTNSDIDGLHTEDDVKTGIQHIIADIVSKSPEVLHLVQQLKNQANIRLESCQATRKEKNTKGAKQNAHSGKKISTANKQEILAKLGECSKFKNYFNFSADVKFIKPHQVLAINRGENQKELTVRLVVPDNVLHRITSFCKQRWLSQGVQYPLRLNIFDLSIQDSYKRLIEPLIVRQLRADLFKQAERAAIEVFALNLKKLLLTPPFRGHTVMGIDPGFRNGCKVAVVAQSGAVLETGVIYLHDKTKHFNIKTDKNALWLHSTLIKHSCAIIALGNGTACRETEEFLSKLIQSGFFMPHLDVSYTIVNEQGASIYSCSEEAKKEFPGLDPNLVSAVSLARRLQDPLAELVKVDPKHQGVGMYQHDVSDKKLCNTLDEIVVECVSFVGVDLNTASHSLLRRISGLNASKANKILDYRKKNGVFISRDDIKKVTGIGDKSYEQCAGFIRILPETVGQCPSGSLNPLDRTWIHPESYDFTRRLLAYCHIKLEDLGSCEFSDRIDKAVKSCGGISYLAQHFDQSESITKLVIDGLKVSLNYDFRVEFEKPLFRKGITSMDDLTCGDVVSGKVMNTTDFGAFVDIGVGRNGLIHKSAMGRNAPQLGDRVQVKIMNVEKERQRIGLKLLDIL